MLNWFLKPFRRRKFTSGTGVYSIPKGVDYVRVNVVGGGGGSASVKNGAIFAKGGEGGIGPGAQGGLGGVAISTEHGIVTIEQVSTVEVLERIIKSAAADRGLTVEEFKAMHLRNDAL